MIADVIDAALALAAQHLWQGAALFVVALGLMRLRALGAELRSWLLLAVFALAVLAPLASFLPGTPAPAKTHLATTGHYDVMARAGEGVGPSEPSFEAGLCPDTLYLEVPRSLSSVLALAWLLGVLAQLVRLFDGWNQAQRLRRSARRAPALEAALADVLPRHARIATTAVDGPMLVGLLRPTILVPRALVDTLEPAALRDIVLHEIAHIRRGDLWLAAALRTALAVFWWSPFLRLIHARLELAREMACDARAAQGGGANVDYAGSLLASVEKLLALGERPPSLAVGMFEHRSHLAQRIDGLIEDDTAATPQRRRALLALCVATLVAFAGMAVATTPRLAMSSAPVVEPTPQVRALLAAARSGDVATVRRLAATGVDLDARALDQGTALIQAVRARDRGMVDALLALGADPDRAALGEGNPLIVASARGEQALVERLVQAGADVNRVVTYDETPLINAAREGHLATVQYLVAHGANVNLGVVADGWMGRWRSPLNQATDPAVRDYLARHGAVAGRP
ncbi:M56 family metallopeptidase [Lysobacter solisilvae (ex Woo and Kim 2020)]|uniref:Ankyrin repeat domain-containing protein n=1 Tax=Agrilutibacter terrestris TaxID=2865112 RepID=A0A7H0FTY3_9GAMM|nr:M56 family metallopeptidase [Lysobacter terrestris]QNP39499.1 ankyrin repeat domain-containing protein [Lysobacter terrestris]